MQHQNSLVNRSGLSSFIVFAAAMLTTIFLPAIASGQNVNGTIVGTVVDLTKAAVPDATVTISDVNTGVTHTVQTDSSGYYSQPDLPPGTYKVTVSKNGFATFVNSGVTLEVASLSRVNANLTPGSVTQTVTVSSAITPALQTDTADTGRDIETTAVAQIPLSTGHNFQNLLNTVPGAGFTVKDHSTFFNPQLSMATTVNGQSSMYNTFDIEGIDDNQRTNLLQIYIPPAESIQEVHISTSNYDPQQGSALGAVTNVILKSGGNDFHGEVFYFYTGNALQARTYFQTTPNHHAVDNYFGGNLGGPISRSKKLFFFGSFVEHRQNIGEFYAVNVPTLAMRNGDFSDPYLSKIYDPTTGDTADCLPGGNAKLCGTGRKQFSYNGVLNVIPPNRLDPIALAFLSHVPPPNANQNTSGATKYTNNLLTSSLFTQDTPDVDAKIDWFFHNNDHISGRFSFENPTLNQAGLYGDYGGPISGGGIAGAEGYGSDKTYSTGVNWVHTFGTTLLSEARFGVSRFNNLAYPTGYGKPLAQQIGIPGANISEFTSSISAINGEGFSDPFIGGCSNCPWNRAGTIIEAVENMTKVHGNHTIEWGVDYHRVRDDLLLVGNPPGNFAFNTGGQTALNGGASSGQANEFASFLLSDPSAINRGYANVFPAYRQNQVFVYVGDKWQASPELTIDAGLRWEYYGPPTPHFAGGFSNYIPSNNTLQLAGIGSIPRNMGMQPDYKNWGPRLGVAYRITPNSVVRAGFGMSTLAWNIDLFAYNYPIEPTQQYTSLSSFGPAILSDNTAATFAKGFPALPAYVPPASGIIPANTPSLLNQSYYAINLNWKNPYLESWNLAYERTLPGSWVLDIAYVGNHGVHTPIQYNANAATVYGQGAAGQPEYGPCAACGSPSANVGRTATTTEYFVGFSSNYNALQIKFDHKFSRGFSMTNSYTYGRALGYASEAADYPNGLLDYVNQRRNYAPTDFNQTHIFSESYIWHLPFGEGAHLASTGIPSKILGGWQLTGMWETMSGFPLAFTCTCSQFNTPGNTAFPNITGSFQRLHGILTRPWFNTSAFSTPAAGTQGNVGNYAFSGPRFFNLDASIFRTIRLTERFNLELRSEWLHATNSPQFGFTSSNLQLGNSSFGIINSTSNQGGSRIIDLAGKVTF
jgi:Carboxypeptidase regulatory-like domain